MEQLELNSKTVIGTTFENGVKEIELVPLSCGLLSFSHPYDGCALYLFSTFYDASAGHIYSIKENSRINSVTLNGNKLIMNTRACLKIKNCTKHMFLCPFSW